jgi:DNA-directed RNA polymerase specialized sigma24 family protein
MKTSNARSRNVEARSNLSAHDVPPISEQELQTVIELDEVLAHALRGDRRAVGAIAVAFGPLLLEEAEAALGRDYAQDAADVLQEFFLAMVEGDVRLRPVHGRALRWMCGVVRAIARKYRGDRDWEWDVDSDVDDEP